MQLFCGMKNLKGDTVDLLLRIPLNRKWIFRTRCIGLDFSDIKQRTGFAITGDPPSKKTQTVEIAASPLHDTTASNIQSLNMTQPRPPRREL
jgi:hypothetical protein